MIESVFEDSDLVEEQRRLEQWLRCAFSTRQLSEEKMCLIPRMQINLLRLLEAATLLARECANKDRERPDPGEALDQRWFFRRRNTHQYASRYYPRYLRIQQYINPYKVFESSKNCLSPKDWEKLLADMLTAATSKKIIYDINSAGKVYELCHALLKVLEAAHLVYVREIQKPWDMT